MIKDVKLYVIGVQFNELEMNNDFTNIPEFYKFFEEYNNRFKGEILSAAEIKAM